MKGSNPDRNDREFQLAADRRLAAGVCARSTSAWHEFLTNYSGLIYSVLRRQLFAEDEDDVRSAYVNVLESLYDGGLENYGGRAPLSTWLAVFARGHAVDLLRHTRGRYRTPASVEKLGRLDREVLRLYYVERLPLEIVVHELSWSGLVAKAPDVVASIQRIEEQVDRRYLTRLENGYAARMTGARSISVLKYLIRYRQEYEERIRRTSVDAVLSERNARKVAARIREMVDRLPDDERRALKMRFESELPAREIASAMGLEKSRAVYTLVNRAIRRMREWLLVEPMDTTRSANKAHQPSYQHGEGGKSG